MGTYNYTGTAADNSIQIFNSQPSSNSTNICNVNGAGGIDTLVLNNIIAYPSASTRFPSTRFSIGAANANGMITVTGSSTGGSPFTFNLTSVEKIAFSDQTVTLTYADTTPPVFASAAVNGSSLVMTYTEATSLDATNIPAPTAFTVSGGHNVTGVAVNAVLKTVTLTLGTAVANGETVTISYTDPTAANDANAIQDAAGNDAATIITQAVTNNTPDTTAPVFANATVNGGTLVMTYTEANTLDATNKPLPGAFTVSGGHSVTAVAVDAALKKVTLTLGTAVANGETVTVSYTDPTGANDANAIQDAAGNDAATITTQAVTNNTPDTTAPVFANATVNGSTLVMTYTEANTLDATNKPLPGAFTVSGGHSVTTVSVDAALKTVTLTLGTAVANGETVTVSYTDPTAANDANAIQDAAGNDAATITTQAVTNNTPDTTAPVFASATVNGSTLVLNYTEANTLDATNKPLPGAFTVSGGHSVTAVAVDAALKKVTLTLGTAVANGETVTVSYTDPTAGNDTNAIQDSTGNDAATITTQAVTNNTPDTIAPVFASATVNGSSLVLNYTEANTLDATNKPLLGAFTVSGGHSVTAVAVNAALKTVTLTLGTAVANGETVTVSYTDPTGGNDLNAIQDAAGNDAATITTQAVTNNTPDTTAPVFASATVNGSTLVMTYTEANMLDATNVPAQGVFTVSGGHSVTGVAVNAALKTVTLTLGTAVTNGETVTVSYTDPTAANDTNAIQDVAGNDAATITTQAVTNNTPLIDTTAPVFASAAVNGSTLVLNYTEANTLDAINKPLPGAFTVSNGHSVTAVAVNAAAKTVTLTLGTAVTNGETVTVSYTDPTVGNDANAIQDATGNDAATIITQAVTNNTGDITAPVFASATVNGSTLVLNYTEANTLDATNKPLPGAFTVSGGHSVTAVAVDAALKTVTLTLGSAVANGETVTVSYTDPTAGNDTNAIQDGAGNDAVTITTQTVTNNTPDSTAPLFASATVNGSVLVLNYTEANSLDATNKPLPGAFTVSGGHSVTAVAVNAAAKTVTLTLGTAVKNGEAVTVSYTDPTVGNDANAIQDATGNDAATITMQTVTNNTPDTTAPVFASATVNGSMLVLNYTEANTLDATNVPPANTFSVSGGHSVTGVAVNASSKTVTLTLGSPVANTETVTVSYTDPTAGNDVNAIQDGAGNDAATITMQTVTNNTLDTTPPVFANAAVNGSTLVLNYTEANTLDATNKPLPAAFTVSGGHNVTGVALNAVSHTVTLTLGTAVANGETVTVSYTDPTAGNDVNAIQDAAGNDAATITTQTVTNNTPDTTAPLFASAAVNGNNLVLTYTEANTLDATNPPGANTFTISGTLSGGHNVTAVAVDAMAKTVTLTLGTAVSNGETVTVSYTDPTAGNDANAIQDGAGNDAATIISQPVTNNGHAPTGSVMITGTATIGNTLIASNTLADADGIPGAISYQWYSGSTAISGVTGDSLLLTDAQKGQIILVKASYIDGHGTPESVSSGEISYGATLGTVTPVTSEANLQVALEAIIPLAGNGDVQTGMAHYYDNLLAAGVTGVEVQHINFLSNSAGAFSVSSSGHEALVIELPSGSSLALNNVEFALISGNTSISGGAGDNIVFADDGNQNILLGDGNDELHGGGGNDTVASTTGDDLLFGDAGDDTLSGGAGNDTLDGGDGADRAVFTGLFSEYIIIQTGFSSYTIEDKVPGRDGKDVVSNVELFQFADFPDGKTDIIAPTVVTFTPADAATGVPVGSNVVLTFSEPVQKGTGLIEIHSGTETGALVASYEAATSTNLSISGTLLTINPTADLAPGTHYFVTLADGSINDYAGNHFAGTTAYDFTTADPYVANNSSGGVDVGVAIAGVGGLGVLAWLLF